MYCCQCGGKLLSNDRFCGICGEKVQGGQDHQTSTSSSDRKSSSQDAPTFNDYLKLKGNERANCSINEKSQKRPFSKENEGQNSKRTKFFNKKRDHMVKDKPVLINVGIIEVLKNGLAIVRGSKLPVKVNKDFGSTEVLNVAISKHANHDQYFCALEDYVLLYPDQKEVKFIPGSQEPFTVEKYKNELGKPYSRLDLYVCVKSAYEYEKEADKENETSLVFGISNTENQEQEENDTPSFSAGQNPRSTTHQTVNNVTPTAVSSPDAVEKQSFLEMAEASTTESSTDVILPDLATLFGGWSNNFAIHKEAKLLCPICNKKYLISEIESHANDCLQRKQEKYIFIDLTKNTNESTKNSPEEDKHMEEEKKPAEDPNSKLSDSDIVVKIKDALANPNVHQAVNHIEVRRGNLLNDFVTFFSKKWNQGAENNTYKFTFLGEAGIDTGGLSREFYTECFEEIKDQYFLGIAEDGFEPTVGMISIANGIARRIGQVFAASLVHGGPAPGFLAPWIFNFLCEGLQGALKNLPSTILADPVPRTVYEQVMICQSDDEVRALFSTENAQEILEAVGFRGNPFTAGISCKQEVIRSIFIKYKLEPLHTALTEISEGLACFNVLEIMKKHQGIFFHAFCPSSIFQWKYEKFRAILQPQYGDAKKQFEVNIFKMFLDYTESCFKDDSFLMSSKCLMKFLTGSPYISPMGDIPNFKVFFKHNCEKSENGTACKCLPIVSTCSFHIIIPTHIKNQEEMSQMMTNAINMDYGFGRT